MPKKADTMQNAEKIYLAMRHARKAAVGLEIELEAQKERLVIREMLENAKAKPKPQQMSLFTKK